MRNYSSDFFDSVTHGALASAEVVFSELFKFLDVNSILDVGAGTGTWTKVFHEKTSSNDILALDGNYVNLEQLLIPKDCFTPMDLSKPFDINRKFDLVISMEVAEHLPASSAASFVKSLTKHSDVILFSAAIPGQRGTYHINEQYPEYWQDLFAKEGFIVKDCIRDKIWDNEKVEPWYRQNSLVFVRESELKSYPRLNTFVNPNTRLTQIHPKVLAYNVTLGNYLDSFIDIAKYRYGILKQKRKGLR